MTLALFVHLAYGLSLEGVKVAGGYPNRKGQANVAQVRATTELTPHRTGIIAKRPSTLSPAMDMQRT